jgi:acetyl esterase/lipase
MRKVLTWIVALVVVLALGAYALYEFTPWPRALLIRYAFETEAAKVKAALAKYVPEGISEELDIQYAPGSGATRLDIYYPSTLDGTDATLPTIVWTHGGAFISGSKGEVANYLKILAGKGYTVVSVGYSLAPGAKYPTPIRQLNEALGFLKENGHRHHVDASRLVLAGDSAGAQIAAETANIVSVPSYAEAVGIVPAIERERLQGLLLFCGIYDLADVDLAGGFSGFLRTVIWAYSGAREYDPNSEFATMSVAQYVTSAFPRAFISAGNGDPLLPQSIKLATELSGLAVRVDTLFFPETQTPPLPHEYQFNLDTAAGNEALSRALEFLADVVPRD